MYNEGIAVWVWFLSEVLMIALIIVGPIIVFRRLFKRKSSEENVTQEQAWDFGDEWKSGEENKSVTDWEEIVTIPRGNTSMYDMGLEILARKPLDLNQLQTVLSQNQITSKIAPSAKSISPSDGLFVEKKFATEAQRILNIED